MGSYFWQYFLSRQYSRFNSDVVELGCGCGRIAYPLKGTWFEGTYVGVDIDRGHAYIADDKYPEAEEAYMIELVKAAGFRELSIIKEHVQSMLVARK
jgi:predicted RNA methylase